MFVYLWVIMPSVPFKLVKRHKLHRIQRVLNPVSIISYFESVKLQLYSYNYRKETPARAHTYTHKQGDLAFRTLNRARQPIKGYILHHSS